MYIYIYIYIYISILYIIHIMYIISIFAICKRERINTSSSIQIKLKNGETKISGAEIILNIKP